jgi:hypothetical protein
MDLDRYLENVVNIWIKIVIFRKLNIKFEIIYFLKKYILFELLFEIFITKNTIL